MLPHLQRPGKPNRVLTDLPGLAGSLSFEGAAWDQGPCFLAGMVHCGGESEALTKMGKEKKFFQK